MTHFLEPLQMGKTVYGLAQDIFGEEYGRQVITHGRADITVAVVDTNILINDVKHSLLVRPLTSLIEASRIGALKIFASTTVRDEVWEKLGNDVVIRKLKIDSTEARQKWVRGYLPWITFLDPKGLPMLSYRVKEIKDLDDVPTGQIIELLRPDIVLCYDTKQLGHLDVTAKGWVQVVVAYRDISRREGIVVGIEIVGTVTVQVTFGVALLSLFALAKLNRKVYLIVGLLLVIALASAMAHPTSRRWLLTKCEAIASSAKLMSKPYRRWSDKNR